jgi:ribosomal protein S18 acetylase RimI-like enzyme
LAISKEEFLRHKAVGLYGASPAQADLSLKRVSSNYEMFFLLLRIVGGPYGWHRRREYHDEFSLDDLIRVLKDRKSRLWLFKWGRETVGYCCAASVEPDLSGLFAAHAGSAPPPQRIAEIYKIGLFDEYTGHGWGKVFLPQVFERLFRDHDAVYLNTRSTNHGKVVPFYESLGMRVIHREECEDDLLPRDLGAPSIDEPRG